MKLFALIFLTAVVSTQAQSDPNYCYSTDTIKPQRAMFSTKTAYEMVRGRSINPNVSSECEKGLVFKKQRWKLILLNGHNQSRLYASQILDAPTTWHEKS
jgi:hypothetical protein